MSLVREECRVWCATRRSELQRVGRTGRTGIRFDNSSSVRIFVKRKVRFIFEKLLEERNARQVAVAKLYLTKNRSRGLEEFRKYNCLREMRGKSYKNGSRPMVGTFHCSTSCIRAIYFFKARGYIFAEGSVGRWASPVKKIECFFREVRLGGLGTATLALVV